MITVGCKFIPPVLKVKKQKSTKWEGQSNSPEQNIPQGGKHNQSILLFFPLKRGHQPLGDQHRENKTKKPCSASKSGEKKGTTSGNVINPPDQNKRTEVRKYVEGMPETETVKETEEKVEEMYLKI